LNCGAFSRELIEMSSSVTNRGRSPGQVAKKQGCFELADGGTLFLNEFARNEAGDQVKFLRRSSRRRSGAWEEGEVTVHCRVLAATNQDLQQAVESGKINVRSY